MLIVNEIVNTLRKNHRVYFESVSPPEVEVLSITNHPNSCVARLRVRLGVSDKALFVKTLYPDEVDGRSNRSDREYKEYQIRTEYDVLKKLYDAFAPYPNLGVVKPVDYFPEYLALVTEEQQGQKFSLLMQNAKMYSRHEKTEKLVDCTCLCGAWLRLFQDFMKQNDIKKYDFNEVLNYCDVRLDILANHRPYDFTEPFCEGVRNFLKHQVKRVKVDGLEVVGRHNDYSPNNMIVKDQKLVVLDFSGFSYGPVCGDYVKFWSGLDLMKDSLLVSVKTVEKLQEAFIAGYGRKINPDDPLFILFQMAYILDKMGDIWLDWPFTSLIRRRVHKDLYQKCLRWLKATTGM